MCTHGEISVGLDSSSWLMMHDNNTSLFRSLKTSQQITRRSTNVVIMLAHRLRRWTNIKTTFIHQLLFVEIILSNCFNLYTANHNYWKWYNLSHHVVNSSQSVILLLLKAIQSVTWRDELITVRHSVVIKSDTICHMTWWTHHSPSFCCY